MLRLSGVGAGTAPLLWAVIPVYWLGAVVEVVASGSWLGHLLGLTLRAVEMADDETARPALIARTNLAQGMAAALGPLIAAAAVGSAGTVPILVASGLICLAATGIIGDEPSRDRRVKPVHVRRHWLAPRGHTDKEENRLALGTLSVGEVDRRARARVHPPAPPATRLSGSAAGERRVRAFLPLALKRTLAADCPSCRGPGCRSCYGIGLG